MLTKITVDGQSDYIFANKALSAAQVAGTWTLMAGHARTPPAATFAATDLTYVRPMTRGRRALYHGGDVSTATKHMLNMGGMMVAAAGAPWLIMPIDLIGYVPLSGANVTSTGTKTVTMTAIGVGAGTGDRYPNGTGLRLFVACDTVMGANAPTCIINYLDTGGGAGATTTFTSTASLPVGALLNTGAAANKYNPFLPLAAGDTGVSDIVNLVWAGTAPRFETVIIGLCAPLQARHSLYRRRASITSTTSHPPRRRIRGFGMARTFSSSCFRRARQHPAARSWRILTTPRLVANGFRDNGGLYLTFGATVSNNAP
ncbi:MAG: hypothetical protein IPI85_17815 [Dehalococcoidia bacterium]|nr:hypothetical protein [Dehalococcoidia bacterium]